MRAQRPPLGAWLALGSSALALLCAGAIALVIETQQGALGEQPVRALQWRVALCGAILAALSGYLGWLAGRAITRPLRQLAELAPRLEQGESGALATTGAWREAELLRAALESLAAKMQQRASDLQVRNALLEHRVEQCGVELREALAQVRAGELRVERMKDEFVSTVSHELRTPLTAMYGSLALLHGGMAGELPAEAKQLVAISHDGSERLIRLVDDLLDLEKLASGDMGYRMQDQPLAPLVEQAVRDAQAGGARAAFDLRVQGAPVVKADADRMVQVCVNLLSNAAKFSPPGAPVEVRVEARDGHARVAVADQGPGVPPEFQQRLFERFAQADASDRRAQGGTGLGLAICRSIVQAHGGRLGFTSEPGVRTEFFFELPLARA